MTDHNEKCEKFQQRLFCVGEFCRELWTPFARTIPSGIEMIHFPYRQEVRKRIGHAALILVLIGRSMIVFAQSVPNNSPLDLDQIGKEYGKNAVNADLLYKGKILAVRGTVVSIGKCLQGYGGKRKI
jgi:hypothetical protein